MIEKIKTYKYGYKCIAMLLVFALSLNMLAGCGKSGSVNNTVQDEYKTENTAPEKDTEKESADSQENTMPASELLGTELDTLEEQVKSGNVEETATHLYAVEEAFGQMAEEAEEIIGSSDELSNLSDEAQSLLEKRKGEFQAELSERKTKAEDIEKALKENISSEDAAEVLGLIEEARELLRADEDVHTYGSEISDKPEVYRAVEAELYNAEKSDVENFTAKDYTSEISDEKLISCTGIMELTEEMKKLAGELDTPLNIYNYIKNNIDYEYYYGSRKGAAGTFESKGGNDVDQAGLLIAMLRYKGYPSMYVEGNILLEPEKAMSLMGADTAEHAAAVLASNGVPVTRLTSGGKTVYLKIEHVWVRTLVPYGNYRGAGDADGESVWIDLDTGIKEYESVHSVYDTVSGDTDEIAAKLDEAVSSGAAETFENVYNDIYAECEDSLSGMDLNSVYFRKRIIKQRDEVYLPLSLQYEVDSEEGTFAELPDRLRDQVTFEVDGCTLGSFNADELSGKSILLSYEAATDADEEILSGYGDIFTTPSYAVHMTPVLYVDGEAVSDKEEELLYSPLGTDSSFSIVFHTNEGNNRITNTITAGSMYAVTIDVQSISDADMESLYDEIITLKDSVSEKNVYSPEYMGRYLEMTGKLYFAQLDLTYAAAADSYNVAATRNISEAITGYEAEKEYIYGMVSGIDFGYMFMDVDKDSHSVVSLLGDENAEREYLLTTGIMGSEYESGIFEELMGEPAVSTISILEDAVESGVDILAINSSNLEDALILLDTADEVVSEIRTAAQNGYTVFIPREEMVLGSWNGVGYIVLSEDGTAAYRISGGLNGGSTQSEVIYDTMVEFGLTLVDITEGMLLIFQSINMMAAAGAVSFLGSAQIALAGVCIGVSVWSCIQTFKLFDAYMDGNEEAGEIIVKQTIFDVILTVGLSLFSELAKPILSLTLKNKLVKSLGADVVEELLANGAKLEDISKLVTNLKKLGLSDEVISMFAKNFGDIGLDWLRKARGLGASPDVLKQLSQMDGFADKMDEIFELMKSSSKSADDVAECLIKNGDEAIEIIRKYGDDAVDAIIIHGDDAVTIIGKYGDDAVDRLKQGKTPDEIEKELGGKPGENVTSGLTSEKIADIINTPKGSRPNPSEYLSKEYIDNHLSKFDDGAAYILSKDTYDDYFDGRDKLGWPDGTQFVLPKNEVDKVLNNAGGDLAKLEKELGYNIGSWEDGDYIIMYVNNPKKYNISLPSGNEMGANNNWIPGGYTSGGIPEAVVYDLDNTPEEVYFSEPIKFKRK